MLHNFLAIGIPLSPESVEILGKGERESGLHKGLFRARVFTEKSITVDIFGSAFPLKPVSLWGFTTFAYFFPVDLANAGGVNGD